MMNESDPATHLVLEKKVCTTYSGLFTAPCGEIINLVCDLCHVLASLAHGFSVNVPKNNDKYEKRPLILSSELKGM